MRLRNKKTGAIVYVNKLGLSYNQVNTPFDLGLYNSLAELNAEWEDYTPQEPLIKDEKIRKAVMAWAKLNGIKEIIHKFDIGRNECCSYIHDVNCEMLEIGFKEKLPLGDNALYTITELCGEEEQ